MSRKYWKALLAGLTAALCIQAPAGAATPEYPVITEVRELPAASAQFNEKEFLEASAGTRLLREEMLARKSVIIVKIKTKETDINRLVNAMYQEVLKEDPAEPEAGDYLRENLQSMNASAQYLIPEGSSWIYYELSFQFQYLTNASQEAYVTKEVKRIAQELKLSSKPQDERVKAVYDYVTSHVKYDSGALNGRDPLAHSAYNAVSKGKAVCQGYVSLIYRLMREADVPVRTITGQSRNQNHAWNIVKLDSLWYNLDATWDAASVSAGMGYQYFLKGSAEFDGHIRDTEFTGSFLTAFPMSSGSYGKYQSVLKKVTGVKAASYETSLKLSWIGQAAADGYKVYAVDAKGVLHLTAETGTNSAKLDGLKPGTAYAFVVKAYKGAENGVSSDKAVFYTKPAAVVLSKLATKSKSITVSWKKAAADGYQLQYGTNSSFKSAKTVTVSKSTTVSKKISSLKKGQKYYFRVRAFRTVNGKKQYGTYSNTKSIVCK